MNYDDDDRLDHAVDVILFKSELNFFKSAVITLRQTNQCLAPLGISGSFWSDILLKEIGNISR